MIPTRVTIVRPNAELSDIGIQHRQMPQLLRYIASGNNVWIHGPAGSGKTRATKEAAKALGKPYFFTGAVDTEYKLLGFTDAQGRIVRRAFREAWQHGGVFLFDEIDSSLPGALLALNGALAGDLADFPDGCMERHPDCVIVAAANTVGEGATSAFSGRLKQDRALIDRFSFLPWGIDEALEAATCPNNLWVRYVQAARAAATAKGLQVQISPRASYQGANLLAAGCSWDEAAEAAIKKTMTEDQWSSIRPNKPAGAH
jgi:hypothetical protein